MKLTTTRFGEIEVQEHMVFRIPQGVLGFPATESYTLIENPAGGPFKWLQAIDNPDLAFVVCDPRLFVPEYEVELRVEDAEAVGLSSVEGGFVLVILTVPEDVMQMTANLLGPLVFNPDTMMARQVVLTGVDYTTRHSVFQDVPGDDSAGGNGEKTVGNEQGEA